MNGAPTGPEPSRSTDIEGLLSELSGSDTDLISPPAELWDQIERAVADNADELHGPNDDRSPTVADQGGSVVSLDTRRRPRATVLVAAAAAVLVVIGVGVSVVNSDSTTQIAQTELAYDPDAFDPLGADAAATATLVNNDGTLTVQINESALPSTGDADLEVWLIEPDGDGNPVELVSLGTIDPDNPSEFAVPASHDPDVFSVVDISVEPHDGNPDHSGRSILRGTFTTT
jgi:anti-sigma-K factor RskA